MGITILGREIIATALLIFGFLMLTFVLWGALQPRRDRADLFRHILPSVVLTGLGIALIVFGFYLF